MLGWKIKPLLDEKSQGSSVALGPSLHEEHNEEKENGDDGMKRG